MDIENTMCRFWAVISIDPTSTGYLEKTQGIQEEKSAAFILTKRYKISTQERMVLEHIEIPYVEETKYLGGILDRTLL